jgi:LysM repeat protein
LAGLIGAGPAVAYRVRPGDSLSAIAVRYGTTVANLERLNGLRPGATLLAGSELRLSQPREVRVYTVRPGDTLSGIARSFHSSIAAIAQASGIGARRILLIGTTLDVPVAMGEPARRRVVYTVRAGDSLSVIAARFGVGLSALVAMNHLQLNAPLPIGKVLSLPPGAAAQDARALASSALEPLAADPFGAGEDGYDVSYPNCTRATPAPRGFVVIGADAGRPFTVNPCFAREYQWALGLGKQPDFYLNSAYSPELFGSIAPACRRRASSQPLGKAAQQAYALGCSEAVAALAPPIMVPAASAIWIDVETSNSWSPRRALNIATIKGMLTTLRALRPTTVVGLYSNTSWWRTVAGGWSVPHVPEWSTPLTPTDCPPSFAKGPVWLRQDPATTVDTDEAC